MSHPSTAAADVPEQAPEHHGFSNRSVFILAAIGSAVGLGNIWRFPYTAYANGGGSFVIPYLVALLVAGLPFLYLDYAIGHKFRGSSPLSLRRLARWAEPFGWWHVLICAIISVYYAAIIAWSARYTLFSVDKAWGDSPKDFFFGDFLGAGDITPGPTGDFRMGILIPMVVLWVLTLIVLAMGVQGGIGRTAVIFIPLLVLAFVALVIQALMLPGSSEGLNAFFTPDWGALTDFGVWIAAFGQIFFSLSIGFGIMITYAAYVRKDTDMTGSGAVVGFANSSFEVLAGIGVFSALGFMAQASNTEVSEVAGGGIGLAFIAFPAIISEAPGGAVIGVLFFASLVVAGLTSLISIVEVVIASVRDKFGLGRIPATLAVGVPMAAVSTLLFSTTGAIYVLDVVDMFVNNFGVLTVAALLAVAIAWGFRRLGMLAEHMNLTGSFRLGPIWKFLISVVVPVMLIVMLVQQMTENVNTPYEGYPRELLTIGWVMIIALPIVAFAISLTPWHRGTDLSTADIDRDADDPTDRTVYASLEDHRHDH